MSLVLLTFTCIGSELTSRPPGGVHQVPSWPGQTHGAYNSSSGALAPVPSSGCPCAVPAWGGGLLLRHRTFLGRLLNYGWTDSP